MEDASTKTVLLVEDDRDIRETIAMTLQRVGYKVLAAAHGREGLDQLAALGGNPDLILLDWMMPVMAGSHFLEQLDITGACRGVPIIVLSAVDRVVNVHATQVTAVIPKPVRLRTLVDVIDRLVGLEHRTGAQLDGRITGRLTTVREDATPVTVPTPIVHDDETKAIRRQRKHARTPH